MEECLTCHSISTEKFNFCPNCGAKRITQRITIRSIITEFIHNLTHFDGPFFTTLQDMALRTSAVTDGYIRGVRKKYLSPIRFLLISFSISGLFLFLISEQLYDYYDQMAETSYQKGYEFGSGNKSEANAELAEEVKPFLETFNRVMGVYQKNTQLIGYLLIPIYGLVGLWLFGRRLSYNFAEFAVVALYTVSFGSMITNIIGGITFFASAKNMGITLGVISVLGLIISVLLFRRAFSAKFWRTLLFVILSFLIFVVVVNVVVLGITVVLVMFS